MLSVISYKEIRFCATVFTKTINKELLPSLGKAFIELIDIYQSGGITSSQCHVTRNDPGSSMHSQSDLTFDLADTQVLKEQQAVSKA